MKLPKGKLWRGMLPALLCVLLVGFTVLSLSTMAAHAGHSCHEASCEICACVEQAKSTLRILGALIAFGAAGGLLAGAGARALTAPRRTACLPTPISLCVRLDL